MLFFNAFLWFSSVVHIISMAVTQVKEAQCVLGFIANWKAPCFNFKVHSCTGQSF